MPIAGGRGCALRGALGRFLCLAMASTLYEEAQLYDRRKVNDSDKRTILCERAQDVVKALPESPDTKALGVKIKLVLTEPKM